MFTTDGRVFQQMEKFSLSGIMRYTIVVEGILLIVIELESFSTLSCTLLYAGVQLERHRTSKHQDHGNNVIYSV